MQENRYFEAGELYTVVRKLIQNSGWRRQKDEYCSNLSEYFVLMPNLLLIALPGIPFLHHGHYLIQVNPRILP